MTYEELLAENKELRMRLARSQNLISNLQTKLNSAFEYVSDVIEQNKQAMEEKDE
uniref:Uncharacterized protein n=1 Tax=viral metagenome TaxID=1070528 RepID=A0A6M3LHK5_9ZZZZ